MLLFNSMFTPFFVVFNSFQNISCYCLTIHAAIISLWIVWFQNISCYCLTNEKSLFLNRFFTKKNDFISFFNIFTNPLTNFNLSWKTTYSSRFYYFFKKSLGKISKTSFPHVSWHFLLWIQSIKYATLIYKSIYKHKILSKQYSKSSKNIIQRELKPSIPYKLPPTPPS